MIPSERDALLAHAAGQHEDLASHCPACTKFGPQGRTITRRLRYRAVASHLSVNEALALDARARTEGREPAVSEIKFPSARDCPDAEKHTPHPDTPIGYDPWARAMHKTHQQERCPTCGYWTIWVPRGKAAP